MASNYNQRSSSSGSNARKKTSASKNAGQKNDFNRAKAGYYASASKKAPKAESFASRAAKKSNVSLSQPTHEGYSMPSGAGRTFTAKNKSSNLSSRGNVSTSTSRQTTRSAASRQSTRSAASRQNARTSASAQSQSGHSARASSYAATGSRASARSQTPGRGKTSASTRIPKSQGRTIRDIRSKNLAASFFTRNRALLTRLIIILGASLAVFGAGYLLYHAPVLKIESVSVAGNDYLSEEAVLDLADVTDDATIINPGIKGIEDRLLANPWVQSVKVKREFPTGLEITITERTIEAIVQVPVTRQLSTETKWAISADGVWLDQVATISDSTTSSTTASTTATTQQTSLTDLQRRVATDAKDKPSIVDVSSTLSPNAGETCADAGILNALTILSSSSDEFSALIAQVSAASAEKTTLLLKNGVTVAFGSANNLQSKERVVMQLLEEHAGDISYINVRVVDRPAWRGLT
jgi:cell division protein FtsQ